MSDKRTMKSAARLYAVQALFQMEASGQTAEAVETEFEDHRFGTELYEGEEMAEGDTSLFRKLVGDAVNNQAKIEDFLFATAVFEVCAFEHTGFAQIDEDAVAMEKWAKSNLATVES